MNDLKRYRLYVIGIIQGVGFRPFIYRMAIKNNLKGFVKNQGAMVAIDIEGTARNIKAFVNDIYKYAPVVATIEEIKTIEKKRVGYKKFWIEKSAQKSPVKSFISPDIAICKECIKELNIKHSRRCQYPFTNCTDCGPRYSIIKQLPYDRENTAMSAFEMCVECQKEYTDVTDRRFHSQTNCCPSCGPEVTLFNHEGYKIICDDPVEEAVQFLLAGKIIAVKGIGGYHLCCNALDKNAINTLRLRKHRPDRPLAIMASSINAVKRICKVSKTEESILSGTRRPIVLLKKKHNCILPDEIAPMQNALGVMLPYTPLHYLLFCGELEYLIMTSGNISGMPICYKDTNAFSELNGIANGFLVHNRDIVVPVDDSVVRVVGKKEMVSRCGRGYSPAVFPIKTKQNIIALGAEQKSSITILQKGYATLSQYLGDMKTYDTYLAYNHVLEHLKRVLKVGKTAYVHDLNPDYLSSQYALQQEGIKIAVQHHHAHMAGGIAEHGLIGRVIGVIYDGTGLGTDGAVWGGEILVGTTGEYERVAHWQYVTLQGGDMLVKEPWRGAVCYLHSIGKNAKKILKDINKNDIDEIEKAIKAKILCCQSSSIGRLFDAVAAMLGVMTKITYDAQAAIELEAIAAHTVMDYYNFTINEESEQLVIEYEHIIRGIVEDLRSGINKSVISAKFHNTIINATVECVNKVREKTQINDVVLGGGVFENQYLLLGMMKKLKKIGFNTYHNLRVPINDGGISFGQAAVAAELLKEMN